MTSYIIRRVLRVIVLLLVVSFITFVIFYVFPSADPAVLRAGPHPSPLLIATVRHKLGLNSAYGTVKKYGNGFHEGAPPRSSVPFSVCWPQISQPYGS